MYKTTFWADFLDAKVEGWTDGSLWNGWATPYFEFPEAQRIVDILNQEIGVGTAEYQSADDIFVFKIDGEEEAFGSITVEVEGSPIKLYAIGTRTWIWDIPDE